MRTNEVVSSTADLADQFVSLVECYENELNQDRKRKLAAIVKDTAVDLFNALDVTIDQLEAETE